MAGTTKAKINILEGTVELEGSEDFVKQYLDEFKGLLERPAEAEGAVISEKTEDVEPEKRPAKKPARGRSTSTKKSTSKVSVERFDIHGEGDVPSLEAYIDEKKPGTGNGNIIAVIGHYITEKLGEDSFSEGQVEYAYKMLKIKRPNHLRQIMINEKNKRDLFEPNAEDSTKWHLTRSGEIFVSDMLPES